MMERSHGPLILKEGLFKDRALNPDGTVPYIEEIRNLFMDKEKMKVLARGMIRGWTLESFLGLVEMAQFKERVIAVIKEQNEHFIEGDHDRQRFKFHDHCPKSSIVFSGKLDDEDLGKLVEDAEREKVVEMEVIQEENQNEARVHDDVAVIMEPIPSANEMAMNNGTPMGMLPKNDDREQVEERDIVLMDVDV